MDLFVPFDASGAKTRLAPVLDADERDAFARAMLEDVLAAIDATGRDATVVATAPVAVADATTPTDVADATVTVDERGLDDAVNARLASAEGPVAVVMADLPLATPAAIERLFAPDADVVLAPGRGGGTNAFVARHPEFRVDYHGASIRDHRRIATDIGASVTEADSFQLATDVDEPVDLAEVLLHGRGAARDWLVDAGFELAVDGRVTVERG